MGARGLSAGSVVGIGTQRVERAPHRLRALGVGSGIAVTLWDRERRVGGLAHVPLPHRDRDGDPPRHYVDEALRLLHRELCRHGARPGQLEAKAVGGASLLRGAEPGPGIPIGAQNVRATFETLEALGIPLVASDLGGGSARSVTLDTGSGAVEVLRLPDTRRIL